jgi:hypothetical protein
MSIATMIAFLVSNALTVPAQPSALGPEFKCAAPTALATDAKQTVRTCERVNH